MAAKTASYSSDKHPSPQGVWGFFCIWTIVLVLLAAVMAPAAHAQAAPAAEDAKVFGESNNLNGAPESPVQTLPGEAPAQAAGAIAPAADDKKPAYLTEDEPFQLKEYEEPKPATPEPWWQQLIGFVFKLAMVIGLIFLSLAVIKKVSGGRMALNLPNTKGRNIVVLESTHLNPQQAIHMISLGGERLLVVGAGPQGLTTLTEITDPYQVNLFLQAQKSTPSASSFNQVFDLEKVVQDTNSDLLSDTFAEVQDDPRYRGQRGWPGQ